MVFTVVSRQNHLSAVLGNSSSTSGTNIAPQTSRAIRPSSFMQRQGETRELYRYWGLDLPDSRLSLQGKKETPVDGEFKSTRTKASCAH